MEAPTKSDQAAAVHVPDRADTASAPPDLGFSSRSLFAYKADYKADYNGFFTDIRHGALPPFYETSSVPHGVHQGPSGATPPPVVAAQQQPVSTAQQHAAHTPPSPSPPSSTTSSAAPRLTRNASEALSTASTDDAAQVSTTPTRTPAPTPPLKSVQGVSGGGEDEAHLWVQLDRLALQTNGDASGNGGGNGTINGGDTDAIFALRQQEHVTQRVQQHEMQQQHHQQQAVAVQQAARMYHHGLMTRPPYQISLQEEQQHQHQQQQQQQQQQQHGVIGQGSSAGFGAPAGFPQYAMQPADLQAQAHAFAAAAAAVAAQQHHHHHQQQHGGYRVMGGERQGELHGLPYPTGAPSDYLSAQAMAAAAAAAAAVYKGGGLHGLQMGVGGGGGGSTLPGGGGGGHHGLGRRGSGRQGTGGGGYGKGGRGSLQSSRELMAAGNANLGGVKEILRASDLIGRAEELARDQQGCRACQRAIEEGDPACLNIIFEECFDKFVDLTTHAFANYLTQKIFQYCSDDQRLALVRRCAPHMATISTNMHGTRAVQRMVECLSTPEQVRAVCAALAPAAVSLMCDINGNHVIQKVLLRMEPADNQFVFDAVANNCYELATQRHACCVMQRCMDSAIPSQRDQLATQIIANALPLVSNCYSNYVVQYLLDLNIPSYTEAIVSRLRGNVASLSMQKFASNVVEKSLQNSSQACRHQLIAELVNPAVMSRLLLDSYANYVIQRALMVAEGGQLEQLCEAIRPHLGALKSSAYGKRIQAKLLKRMPKACEPLPSPLMPSSQPIATATISSLGVIAAPQTQPQHNSPLGSSQM